MPSSVQALRMRDVRFAIAGAASADTAPTVPVEQSDVVGLISDLGARPLKGPGYAAGRVAYVNPTAPSRPSPARPPIACAWTAPPAPAAAAQPNFSMPTSPAGLVDGANPTFTLAGVPSPASSLQVVSQRRLAEGRPGFHALRQPGPLRRRGVPQPGDTLLASYRLSGGADETPQLYPNPQVLCSGLGAATNSSTLTSLATCSHSRRIPGGRRPRGDPLRSGAFRHLRRFHLRTALGRATDPREKRVRRRRTRHRPSRRRPHRRRAPN